MESTYQHLSARASMMNILHDDGDYPPLIEGHNTNDDIYLFESEVPTTKIKVLMVAYDNSL